MTAPVDRTVEVLTPDVQSKVLSLAPLDGESQTRAVTAMLSHSRTGILAAIAAQDLPLIVEWKAKGAAAQEIAKQLRLGKELQQDATEFVRLAERGLGVAIREGQTRGEVRTPGKKNVVYDRWSGTKSETSSSIPGPTDFAAPHELSGATRSGEGMYAMTDGVSDAQFAAALAEARAEGNLSRANVARKCQTRANPPTPMGEEVATPIPIRRKTGPQRQKARTEARNAWITSAIALQSISTQLARTPISDLEVHAHDTELLQAFCIVADAVKSIAKLEKEVRNEHIQEGA